jgi:hypothetical protein
MPRRKAPNSKGLILALRIAETCVVSPSAAIAIARVNVSTLIKASRTPCGSSADELNNTMPMKPKANHGIRSRCFAPEAAADCFIPVCV